MELVRDAGWVFLLALWMGSILFGAAIWNPVMLLVVGLASVSTVSFIKAVFG